MSVSFHLSNICGSNKPVNELLKDLAQMYCESVSELTAEKELS